MNEHEVRLRPGFESAEERPTARDGRHAVHFYEDDERLCAAVADFLTTGLERDETAVVIATDSRTRILFEHLQARGIQPEDHRLVCLNARKILQTFMRGEMPDADLFHARVGGMISASARARNAVNVRTYGEMVDILGHEGKFEAAIRLEELWNELAERQRFSLFCSYAAEHFSEETNLQQMDEIRRLHDRVLPSESEARG